MWPTLILIMKIIINNYESTSKSTMSYPKFTALKFVAIFISMREKNERKNCILLRIWFSWQEKKSPAITPPKHVRDLLKLEIYLRAS